MIRIMGYITSAALEETGYVVLDPYRQPLDAREWLDLEYVDWKSSGDTRSHKRNKPVAGSQPRMQ